MAKKLKNNGWEYFRDIISLVYPVSFIPSLAMLSLMEKDPFWKKHEKFKKENIIQN